MAARSAASIRREVDGQYVTGQVGRMTDDELQAALVQIAADLVETERRTLALYRLRLRIWTELRRKRNVPQVVVARASGVTPGAVSFSLNKAERKNGKTGSPPVG